MPRHLTLASMDLLIQLRLASPLSSRTASLCCYMDSMNSWHGIGNMASKEAMCHFVRILEEEDPGWYTKASGLVANPVVDAGMKVLDLRTWSWSKIEVKVGTELHESTSPVPLIHCGGHTLIPWGNKLLSIAGHMKNPSETIQGHSVTLAGSSLVIFGGQNATRSLWNDLHLLDLETMTWDEIDTVSVPPSPRPDNAAGLHAEHYLLIFGVGLRTTFFNDPMRSYFLASLYMLLQSAASTFSCFFELADGAVKIHTACCFTIASVMDDDMELERNLNACSTEELGGPRASNGDSEGARNRFTGSGDDGDDDLDTEVREESWVSQGLSSGAVGGEVRVSSGQNLGASLNGSKESRALTELEGDVDARVCGGDAESHVTEEKGDSEKNRVFSEADVANEEVESGFREVADQAVETGDPDVNQAAEIAKFSVYKFDDQNSSMENFGSTKSYDEYKLKKSASVQNDSMIILYDGYAATNGTVTMSMWPMKFAFGLETGDMVWAKVKSHPWWPGYIFDEVFASLSVQLMKREGHVLVAFFGDSSYGWFELAELIPYGAHYTEKSQQKNSRRFLKAVQESIDEASRRYALGLSCRCRNPNNFRPTNIHGYFAVDVFDYEAGGIYSVSQIKRARENFQPVAALLFLKQLALAPQNVESCNIDFIEKKSISLAYRRAIFEEFDETYAQAFGQEPVQSTSLPPSVTDHSMKDASRAPLSGPQVFAEALGAQKSSTEAIKLEELSRRDQYLFKQRDEYKNSRTPQIAQGHASSSSSWVYEDEPSDTAAAAGYAFQRWHQAVSTAKRDETAASSVMTASNVAGVANHTGGHAAVDLRLASGSGKKIKTIKHPVREFTSEKKKRNDAEMSSVNKQSSTGNSGASAAKLAEKPPVQIAAVSREDLHLSHRKKEADGINSMSEQAVRMPVSGEKEAAELPLLLGDLQGLALNPFHGAQRNRPAILKQALLRFRALVFQKSLAIVPAAGLQPHEVGVIKNLPVTGPTLNAAASENIKTVSSSKLLKPLGRSLDDPTKAGRKRFPSEQQQEEITAKKAKKMADAKPLGAEKRTVQKNPEIQHADGRGKAAAATVQLPPPPPPPRTAKAEPLKRMDRPSPKVEEPTHLVMKYPQGTSLPSSNELKARFARFGPMEPSGNRIFYSTNTCRVTFLYKQDAERAHQYAVGNKSVFANVRSQLKPATVLNPPDLTTDWGEDMSNEPPLAQPLATDPRPAAALLQQQPPQLSSSLLKSILKKPAGDEVGLGMRGARVRFNTAEENSGWKVHLVARNYDSSSFRDPSLPSVGLDIHCNNQKVLPSNPLRPAHNFPFPPQIASDAYNQQQIDIISQRINHSNPNSVLSGQPPKMVDISQPMLRLLIRCSDVVATVKSIYGYVPYHPL
ncbi:hypothetical protein Nepgr_009583 [Nepenthes gracilis]|uniref:PWWP domain-containing protein n=1 Tax=Nepenthes gracilis TaxID=150966 RepID=A0AAD3SAT5_NEPGR|nr:hypothetical protein Nepgr_009583 [Nepenthes gracilis]